MRIKVVFFIKREIKFCENGLNLVIEIADDGDARLLHLSPLPFEPLLLEDESKRRQYRLVELQLAGCDHNDHHGPKHTGTIPGQLLRFKDISDYRNEKGRKLEIVTQSPQVQVTTHLQFFDGIAAVRSWNEVKNCGYESVFIEYITSFCLSGISKEGIKAWDEKSLVSIAHSTWYGEGQWQTYTTEDLGLRKVIDSSSVKRIACSTVGTWSTSEYLPMGCYENTESGSTIIWQIEHNGSWHWELSDFVGELYLQLSGPTENESHWSKTLKCGESFITVPAAICHVIGDFECAVQEITRYRRAIRRPNDDNKLLPVIFNDYMNCLSGDPTTATELPLIDAAAKAGCEYYCVDCGWYSDGPWWDGVGEWLPSKKRFPGGIKEVLDYIHAKGMIPGLWLEIEVMGVKCPMADKVPDSWFFIRHGKRVIEQGRYQLDFRNPEVIKHANSVIDRLVNEYGVGYIKMDYNINAGPGTETDADSYGDGLLQHNRAYLNWLDKVFIKYPSLVIENCSSGGMRMDYALLSRHSILSSSDQTDYKMYAKIAASVLTGVTPEQSAVWSYPLRDGDCEEVIFNMVNAMLMRIHQSGQLAEISKERFELVMEGIECYKRIRSDFLSSVPIWPLGIPNFYDEWICFGLKTDKKAYLAVYRLASNGESFDIPISSYAGEYATVKCIFPKQNNCIYRFNKQNGLLTVKFPQNYSARLFEIEF